MVTIIMVITSPFASRRVLACDKLEELCWYPLEKSCLPDKREALENRALLWTLSWQDTTLRDVTALLVTTRGDCCHCIEVRKTGERKISLFLVDITDLLSKLVTDYIFPLG